LPVRASSENTRGPTRGACALVHDRPLLSLAFSLSQGEPKLATARGGSPYPAIRRRLERERARYDSPFLARARIVTEVLPSHSAGAGPPVFPFWYHSIQKVVG
jgi:hypothetical protein